MFLSPLRHRQGLLFSTPPSPHIEMQDELNLDRVIDMPVYRDVLTWDVFELGFLRRAFAPFLARLVRHLMVSALIEAMWIAC